jgi:hypothetical protein
LDEMDVTLSMTLSLGYGVLHEDGTDITAQVWHLFFLPILKGLFMGIGGIGRIFLLFLFLHICTVSISRYHSAALERAGKITTA